MLINGISAGNVDGLGQIVVRIVDLQLKIILAVGAIFIWHLFYVVFLPSEFPMSTIWLDGRMPAHEWKTMHPAEYAEEGEGSILRPHSSVEKSMSKPADDIEIPVR